MPTNDEIRLQILQILKDWWEKRPLIPYDKKELLKQINVHEALLDSNILYLAQKRLVNSRIDFDGSVYGVTITDMGIDIIEQKGSLTDSQISASNEDKVSYIIRKTNGDLIKIFVSYSSQDKYLAGTLKRLLECYNFEVFLAHDDIQPTEEWQNRIIQELHDCHIFIPFLTEQFSHSDWTDQETGMAFAWDKLIIPLRIRKNPYGFIGKFQALKVNENFIKGSMENVLRVIKNHEKFTESLKNCLIIALRNAKSFDDAQIIITLLEEYNSYSEEQVNQIMENAIKNNQFRMSRSGKQFLKTLISKYASTISPILKQEYDSVKDSF
jgi:hypothetical protein